MGSSLIPTGQPAPMAPGDYTPAAQSQIVTWAMKRLNPPSPLYVTTDDVLRVQCTSSQAGAVVTINYRLLRAEDGKVVYGSRDSVALPAYKTLFIQVALTEGFLLSVACAATNTTTRGQTFARIMLTSASNLNFTPGQVLMADYVTGIMTPGYPNGRVLAPTEGPGWTHDVALTVPGLGLNWSQNVPSGARWRMNCAYVLFATSAAVPLRYPNISLSAPSTSFAGFANRGVPASTLQAQIAYTKTPNDVIGDPNCYWAALPADLFVLGGSTIQSNCTNLDGADQFTPIDMNVEEWLDNV